jgi:photosystem II stability/assembly factor-like uncharacterized protein
MQRLFRLPIAATGLIAAVTLSCTEASDPVTDPSHAALDQANSTPTFTPQQSGTTERLQAVSPVDDQIVWASGTGGTFTLTTDGGQTWHAGVVAGASNLEFRDVEGISDKVAYLMSAGPGEQSRIFKTDDGGQTWNRQFKSSNPGAFYDCFAFFTPQRGITFSDAVNGVFPAIRTVNGRTWKFITEKMPAAQAGEAAFAASGTCITVQGENRAWIGTGGAATARILATTDGGNTWNAFGTPIVQGTPSSGITTVDFRDAMHGILGGGELADPDNFSNNVAISSDGGQTWSLATPSPFTGSIYGLTYVSGLTTTVIITGPKGAAWSEDEGGTWNSIPGAVDYWAAASASPNASWLVGVGGTILKVSF